MARTGSLCRIFVGGGVAAALLVTAAPARAQIAAPDAPAPVDVPLPDLSTRSPTARSSRSRIPSGPTPGGGQMQGPCRQLTAPRAAAPVTGPVSEAAAPVVGALP